MRLLQVINLARDYLGLGVIGLIFIGIIYILFFRKFFKNFLKNKIYIIPIKIKPITPNPK